MTQLDQFRATNAAAIHASVLVSAGSLPESIAGTRLAAKEATPIYDVNGDVLLWRTPLGGRDVGYMDVAGDSALGAVVVAVAPDAIWSPNTLLEAARGAFRGAAKADEVRFVAYSFPKLAVQFLRDGEEIGMIELFTWVPVPPGRGIDGRKGAVPGQFERWSFLDELPARARRSADTKVEKSIGDLFDISPRLQHAELVIDRFEISDLLEPKTTSAEVHFSSRSTDHHVCFELRGQETNVWCVGASVQMLLDYYRYEYTQTKLATELGLGTKANPNGLPYADVAKVVTVIEKLTGKALDATMLTNPTFAQFRSEMNANRPMISFIPGHSRTVVGYTQTQVPIMVTASYQGLLVFDPWPPNAGVITRWENFATQTYLWAYTAKVTLVP